MFFRTLNSDFRKLMRDKALSPEDLGKAAENLRKKNKKTLIGLIISIIGLFALFALSIIYEKNYMLSTDSIPANLAVAALISLAAGAIGYVFTLGVIKIQFNKELKADYPELYDDLKI